MHIASLLIKSQPRRFTVSLLLALLILSASRFCLRRWWLGLLATLLGGALLWWGGVGFLIFRIVLIVALLLLLVLVRVVIESFGSRLARVPPDGSRNEPLKDRLADLLVLVQQVLEVVLPELLHVLRDVPVAIQVYEEEPEEGRARFLGDLPLLLCLFCTATFHLLLRFLDCHILSVIPLYLRGCCGLDVPLVDIFVLPRRPSPSALPFLRL